MRWWYSENEDRECSLLISDYDKEKDEWYYRPVKEINMWNYTSEGKLPERQEMGTSDRVVVAVRGYNTVDVGYYDYELEGWFVDNNRYPVNVYAWMEVKPPKEEA